MKQVCTDKLYGCFVEFEWRLRGPLQYPNNAYHHSRSARPCVTTACRVDRPAALNAYPAESCITRIALPNCVCGDEAESTILSQQVKGASEKVCNEVSVAVALFV